MVALLRTRIAVEKIREFRNSSNFNPLSDAFIEALCVKSAAVMCVSEIESLIAENLQARVSGGLDAKVSAFIVAHFPAMLKKTAKSDLQKTVATFGSEASNFFLSSLDDRDVTSYSALLRQRHAFAHAEGGDITLMDLEAGLVAAEKVISTFIAAID
jgi:hypothetical protein